ncbi:MAG: hypothetical protein WAZ18_06785 [Alphaproteobacteria bacterium]
MSTPKHTTALGRGNGFERLRAKPFLHLSLAEIRMLQGLKDTFYVAGVRLPAEQDEGMTPEVWKAAVLFCRSVKEMEPYMKNARKGTMQPVDRQEFDDRVATFNVMSEGPFKERLRDGMENLLMEMPLAVLSKDGLMRMQSEDRGMFREYEYRLNELVKAGVYKEEDLGLV